MVTERRMATLSVSLPEDMVPAIENAASSSGKTAEQWVEDTLRAQLEWASWRELFAYGRETGRASGYEESDVPELVKQWRRGRHAFMSEGLQQRPDDFGR